MFLQKLENHIKEKISTALMAIYPDGNIDITIEVPKDTQFGDYSTNVAMRISKILKKSPRDIAAEIVGSIKSDEIITKCEIAGGGFINFYINPIVWSGVIGEVINNGDNFGKSDILSGKKYMVEFVSANPTGPMHMGNARGGALGDCMASCLSWAGCDVTREFYINDAGNQIEKFGLSLEARYMQEILGEEAFLFPEDGYFGDDIKEHAKNFAKEFGDSLVNEESIVRKQTLADYALPKNIEALTKTLEEYRISYDVWFRESSLYESGEVDNVLKILSENGFTYEKDGALWIKLVDESLPEGDKNKGKDEVLVRANGTPTYFAADIAYHKNKLETRGYDRAINVWGADHHGHIARMKKALSMAGSDGDKLEVITMQLVRLMRSGEIVRMSKRTGKSITLSDLLEETGIDAARFFFNLQKAGSHMDFDLDLAVKKSNENPVYYVQYAHARICGILAVLEQEGICLKDDTDLKGMLTTNEEIALLKAIAQFSSEIVDSAITLEPSKITRYVIDLSSHFHTFYNACKVKCDDEKLMMSRIMLIKSVRQVIKNALSILKINAPEKM